MLRRIICSLYRNFVYQFMFCMVFKVSDVTFSHKFICVFSSILFFVYEDVAPSIVVAFLFPSCILRLCMLVCRSLLRLLRFSAFCHILIKFLMSCDVLFLLFWCQSCVVCEFRYPQFLSRCYLILLSSSSRSLVCVCIVVSALFC